MTDQRQVLEICVDVGQTLLASGGEIFRVQETMERIAQALGAKNFQVYVLTNGLFASVEDETCTSSLIRHVPSSTVHMGRITEINALSRDIEAGAADPAQAKQRLEEIRALPYTPEWMRILGCGIGAGCFAYLFGGTALDAVPAVLTGLLLQCFLIARSRHKTGKIINNLAGAALVALCSVVFSHLMAFAGLATHLDKIIIGGIIPLVPGMALTTSIRDFANGDYLSGTIRLMDALLVAGSIAMGVGVVLALAAYIPGVAV